jgi:DNA-binding PucR family transcriptional regulator
MLIRDVLDAGQLRITSLHLTEGALDRVVNWTFTTDLLDPRRYLIRGQLVMTGLVWRRTPEDSETFVSTVARCGAIALMVGEGLFGRVPEDVLEACRRHDLPLFAVPADVSFASITAYISNATANDRVTRATASLTRQRELLTEVYQGHLLDDLVSRTARDLGRPIWMLTATGRHVVSPVEPLDAADLELVVTAALSAARMPATITDAEGGRLTIFAVSGPDDHRTMAWFLVVAGDGNEWHPMILDTVQELATVAGLYRVQGSARVELNSALVDRLVTLIDSDAEQPETAVYLRQVGIPHDQRTVVVAAEFPDHPELQDLARFLLGDAVSHAAPAMVGRDGDGRAAALLAVSDDRPGASPAELMAVEQSLRRLGPGLGGRTLRVGVSQVASVGELGGALRSARFALTLPGVHSADTTAVRINDAADLTSSVQLLSAVPDHLRRVFVDRALGPVVEHDTRYNSQLLATLTTFLDCDGSWVRTAELTHLHLNTVRYRIGQIEELTGRDLSSTADRADLYLALKLT